ncbi:MAG TPA: hypothetical protein VHA33_19185 [Candidatus Angelobacter sp.]|jgi:hypothetical protein|nr:hypothetical protein [Candidatus Angelobacter sp.]
MLPVQVGSSNHPQLSAFNLSIYAAAAPSKGKTGKKKSAKKPTRGKPSKTRDVVINPPAGGGGGTPTGGS